MTPEVLITDIAWTDMDIEHAVLEAAGARVLYAETGDEAELVRLAPRAAAILTCWKNVSAATLDAAADCVVVSRYGVGVDNIAVDHASHLGMLVTNVPDYCYEEVSDHAMALLLACARRIVRLANATRAGEWSVAAARPIPRLRGQTVGLIGFGRNGRALAPKAAGFGMRVLAYDPWVTPAAVAPYAEWTDDLAHLLRESDYVSVHVPLTDVTRGMINAETLAHMKPGAFLINTSRGPIVDEAALAEALAENRIGGAALDVLTEEPGQPTHPLFGFDNVIITPHAAFYSESAIEELRRKAVEHTLQALRGERPTQVINPQVLDQPNCRLKRQLLGRREERA